VDEERNVDDERIDEPDARRSLDSGPMLRVQAS